MFEETSRDILKSARIRGILDIKYGGFTMDENFYPEEFKRQSTELIKPDIISEYSPEPMLGMLRRLRIMLNGLEKRIPEKNR